MTTAAEVRETIKSATLTVAALYEDRDAALAALADVTAACALVVASYRAGKLGDSLQRLQRSADAASAVAMRISSRQYPVVPGAPSHA